MMPFIPALAALAALGAAPTEDALDAFAGFDQNDDGAAEIRSVERLAEAGNGPRVLVFVEPRLLEAVDGAPDLRPHLERYVADLARDGFRADARVVALEPSPLHQDGRFVLALRAMLRAAAAEDPLAGVVLVGRFPDAFLVRTCNWRKKGNVTLREGADDEARYADARFLRRVPEPVARRADIVLADLDGRWDDVYVQPRSRLETVHAVFDGAIPATGGACVDVARGAVEFEDFFHVSDGKLEVAEHVGPDGAPAGWTVTLFDRSGDHEVGAEDRARPNVMAVPDILVSRIDARGSAQRPRTSITGADGESLLDDEGRPRAVRFASKEDVPHWRGAIWEHDPVLERRLLAEFFDRNHAFRTGAAPVAWRPSSVACDLGSGYRIMLEAADDWDAADAAVADLHGRPTLDDVAAWMASPAILRTLRAHSDPWGSAFAKAPTDDLDARLGGPAWSWTPKGDTLVPSLAAACGGGKLDWFLLRSLWEYDLVAHEPAFYHHTGCDGISPPGAANRPYDHPSYGARQGGEALLFFGRGLALVGRAKVFYDEPRGFSAALAEGETFGAAWARYFEIESRATSWGDVGGDIGRKRAYFWSVLGDWTLRLRPDGTTARR